MMQFSVQKDNSVTQTQIWAWCEKSPFLSYYLIKSDSQRLNCEGCIKYTSSTYKKHSVWAQ